MRKNLFLGFFVVFSLGLLMNFASGYDASSPYTVTMKWIIGEDTSFTVSLCGSETSIDFDENLANQTTADAVQPDCQDNSTSTPIMNITNSGNVALNLSCNLTASKPAWATLYVSNDTDYTGASTFDTTAVTIEDNVAVSGNVPVYIWTDVLNADTGTTSRTYQVNTVAS
jgi:hypothetical protein